MPGWVSDAGSISSVFGLIVTLLLLYEAKKIRRLFIRKARLPEITKDLESAKSALVKQLPSWDENNKPALETLAIIRGVLVNARAKAPRDDVKRIDELLRKIRPRKYFFYTSNVSDLTQESVWDIYTDLNTLVSSLRQLNKDLRWE